MTALSATSRPVWDIFCQVIDNFGDIGVSWRLACNLAARGQQVRLWVDDASALTWMAPQGADHVSVHPWPETLPPELQVLLQSSPPQVIVEAFGCNPPDIYIAHMAASTQAGTRPPTWINLEYLSAEDYVTRMHRLPSPISYGPAAGWIRWFFYPGFTTATGGLLREPDLQQRRAQFDRTAWRQQHGVEADTMLVSLFCYEPPGLPLWWKALQQRAASSQHTTVAITPGRASQAMQVFRDKGAATRAVSCISLPTTDQAGFDAMLWASDLNMVRGEDSLVRALWADQPFIWHIYPQDDDAHHAKLAAFLDWLQAPASLRLAHMLWNGIPTADGSKVWPTITAELLSEWRECVHTARSRLLEQADLAEQLMAFVGEKG